MARSDGVCDADAGTAGDQCTLRAAIQEANATTAGDDTISFSVATVTLSTNGTDDAGATGDLDIAQNLTIDGGEGVVIDTDTTFTDRVLHVISPASATVSNITVQNGGRNNSVSSGGGILVNTGATLNLSRSTVRDNTASSSGGGIFSNGPLRITDSTVRDNNATQFAAGIGLFGGPAASIVNSTVSGNNSVSFGLL